jgi:type VI protein secretion system component Hcp
MGIFLKLGDIESDAADKNHTGWIACDSFTGGTTRSMYLETGGGKMRDTSDPELHEIGLRMKMHKGSPKVFMASVQGPPVKAVIHVTRAGDTTGSLNYLEITLTDTYVSRYSMDADGDTPMETISLNYAAIEKKYTPNGSDGKPGSPVPVGFSAVTGKKL